LVVLQVDVAIMQGQFKMNNNGIQEEERELFRDIDIERDVNNNIRLAPIIR